MEKIKHKFQFDFIKIRTQKVNMDNVNWDMLEQHSNIKNAYSLSDESALFGKNFKLYFDKNDCAVLQTSIPYLNHNHNYVKVSSADLHCTLQLLSELLRIDFAGSKVIEFEYGLYAFIDLNSKRYLSDIIGVGNYDLKYNTPFMKMYGNPKVNFKIYDAVSNAKKKKTFKLGDYPKDKLIKFELKFTKPSKFFKTTLIVEDLYSQHFEYRLKEILERHIDGIVESNHIKIQVKGNTVNHFVYAALKNYEQQTGIKASNMVLDLIDDSNISPCQKSKRRRSVKQLEALYHNIQI